MSGLNMVTNDEPVEALRKLAAPNLRSLILCLNLPSPKLTSLNGSGRKRFQMERVIWMKDFAKLKMEQYPDSRLNRIIINFDPGENPGDRYRTRRKLQPEDVQNVRSIDDHLLPVSWPWGFVEIAKDAVAEYGTKIIFEPKWTREELDKIIYDIEDPTVKNVEDVVT